MRATEALSHMLSRTRPAPTRIGDVQGPMNRNSAAFLSTVGAHNLWLHKLDAHFEGSPSLRTKRCAPM